MGNFALTGCVFNEEFNNGDRAAEQLAGNDYYIFLHLNFQKYLTVL